MTDPVHLVVGADGLVGRMLAAHLADKGLYVVTTTRRRDRTNQTRLFLDLADNTATWELPERVTVAVLCAALTKIDLCRQDPATTANVNVTGTVALAKNLAAAGAFVIFLSTNQVFDGSQPQRRPDELPAPATEYGRQKAETEKQLLALGRQVSIVRFTKLLSPDMALFTNWAQALKNGQIIHPFSDMTMAPVPMTFAVEVLGRIAERRRPGIVQVSADQDITYEQAARFLAERLNADDKLIQPIRARDSGGSFESIPRHTTLDTTILRTELGLEPPNVWTALTSVLPS
jgi:dTDP-4-dehydrorhamnose reductase